MRRITALLAGLFCLSSALAPLALADHHENAAKDQAKPAEMAAMADEKPAANTAEMDSDAMMKMMQEMAAPNEHHAHLAKMAGTWNYKSTMWMDPNAPPVESEGKAVNTMILGGRFLSQHVSGTMMGMPFEGMGLDGYDKATGKHTAVWMDNFGTMTMMFEGSCSADDMSTTMMSSYQDPMTGQQTTSKTVTKMTSPTTMVMEMYNVMPDGSEMKTMEINYTKAAEAKKAGS